MSVEPQIKKHLTAEEHAMRRAEMARRRKNLSEKRNEEEKVCLLSIDGIVHARCFAEATVPLHFQSTLPAHTSSHTTLPVLFEHLL